MPGLGVYSLEEQLSEHITPKWCFHKTVLRLYVDMTVVKMMAFEKMLEKSRTRGEGSQRWSPLCRVLALQPAQASRFLPSY